jgi:glycosyltransferase involved in cell wall biosynthesis
MHSPDQQQTAGSPVVSIILPTFNRLQYLPEAIASIVGQTFKDWELLIADDGSDPETRAYLDTLDAPSVKLIRLQHTGKPAVVRNTALREARGEYVAFMDSDDVWMPQKLATQIASLRIHGDCAWSHTKFLLVDANRTPIREMPAADGWILRRLLNVETVIALPSVVVRRALLDQVGGFDEELVMCEDFDLWLRLAAQGPVDAIDEPLTLVRRHVEHYGSAATSLRDSIRVLDKVLRSGTAAHYQSIIRRERAQNSASLARCYAASGHRQAAVLMLLSTAPASWRHAGWWREAIKAMAVMLAPRSLRRTIRRGKRQAG